MKSNKELIAVMSIMFLASCSPKETQKEKSPDTKLDSVEMKTTVDSSATPVVVDEHNSQNSLDWKGTYEAILPCADCPGIKTSLTLNNDNTFNITEEYIDRKSKSEDKGNFEWDSKGSMITLKGKTAHYKYKVGENQLIQLDLEGKEITGPNEDLYVFKKK
ncbi:copper resistance protein NlpE [Chryseobacterium paridis]|uniref:Copper resistance protein NlpE N-terminal domain-containing protein n=1 Tax=Chryseobacterium paridis TaxID=2800328 RepID=A0ABS1FSS0_9FLAO|nr:copper resistance protein NlpE [Chryseobacterium paridis]MBK1895480.1 copper resistance protein NlpE N-terminal domain-containing protein [Chryseobacterium paridis]